MVLSPASRRHQEVVGFLVQTLGVFVRARGLGVVFSVRFQMETGPDLPGREPDLLFVARENLGRLRERYLDGPVGLVVEVAPPAAGCATAGRSAPTTRRTGCGSTGWWTRRHSGRTSTFWVRTGGTTAGGPARTACTGRRWSLGSGFGPTGCGRTRSRSVLDVPRELGVV